MVRSLDDAPQTEFKLRAMLGSSLPVGLCACTHDVGVAAVPSPRADVVPPALLVPVGEGDGVHDGEAAAAGDGLQAVRPRHRRRDVPVAPPFAAPRPNLHDALQ